jgi:hypothetical protein
LLDGVVEKRAVVRKRGGEHPEGAVKGMEKT